MIALLFAALAYLWIGQRLEKKSCYPYIAPPRSGWSLFATLERLLSIRSHDYRLDEARNQGKIAEVNLWPLIRVPVFSIHDPKVARTILENPNSLKPRGLYNFFDGLMGGTSFISEEGERYKHPRKSVSIGISHSNMDLMLTKMHSVMDQWIAANLGKNEGDVVHVDITVEIQKLTILSIGKIAFGYDFSQGETERTRNNLGILAKVLKNSVLHVRRILSGKVLFGFFSGLLSERHCVVSKIPDCYLRTYWKHIVASR